MLDALVRLAFVAGLVTSFGVVIRRSLARSRKGIERWARTQGFVLLRCGCDVRRGGWGICIVDRQGRTREAWARCGNPMIGILSDVVDVRWESQNSGPARTPTGTASLFLLPPEDLDAVFGRAVEASRDDAELFSDRR